MTSTMAILKCFSVTFRVYVPSQNDSMEVMICGSSNWFGNWSEKAGLKCKKRMHGWWEATVDVPFSNDDKQHFLYKYVTAHTQGDTANYTWESNSNRYFELNESSKANVLCDHFGIESASATSGTLRRIMTFNIRFDSPNDGFHSWVYRKPYLVQQIRFNKPSVIGLQEALYSQLTYISDQLGPGYTWIGVGRDDGKQGGEYSPIIYDTTSLKLLDQGTFWLSETPWIPSIGWGASLPRICTWGKFQNISDISSTPFWVFNTHLDHMSHLARVNGLQLINSLLHAWSGNDPAILCGDFNTLPTEKPYTTITDPKEAYPVVMKDVESSSINPILGPLDTFIGWDYVNVSRIDYILTKMALVVENYAVLSEYGGGNLISDHRAVVADIWV